MTAESPEPTTAAESESKPVVPRGIALLGEPGSGKTAIAEALTVVAEPRGRWYRLSFADALRNELAYTLSRNGKGRQSPKPLYAEMVDPKTKDMYRALLQAYGLFRRQHEFDGYWVIKALSKMRANHFYAVDDCRFPNEETALRSKGFVFVRLASGETTRMLPDDQAAHESEAYWRDFAVHIELTYEPGPLHQAHRILAALGLE